MAQWCGFPVKRLKKVQYRIRVELGRDLILTNGIILLKNERRYFEGKLI